MEGFLLELESKKPKALAINTEKLVELNNKKLIRESARESQKREKLKRF